MKPSKETLNETLNENPGRRIRPGNNIIHHLKWNEHMIHINTLMDAI